jgi:hypothetical protein
MNLMLMAIAIAHLPGCFDGNSADRRSQFAGMYKLEMAEYQIAPGVWLEDPWTKGGTGYMVYDGLGHMALHITRRGYKDFDWLNERQSIIADTVQARVDSMSVDQLKSAVTEFSSSYVYVANYTVEDTADIVVHHRISASIPGAWGTTVRRAFSFNGDTLTQRILDGNRRLKWIRQE